jgi:hypothetical protein
MSSDLSAEITAIATTVLAVFAILTAIYAIRAFGKQSKAVSDQAEQLKLQRQANLEQAVALVRGRVWAVLAKQPGMRTVVALGEPGGRTDKRVELLQRTAHELDVAGAKILGDKLRDVWKAGMGGRCRRTSLLPPFNT